MSKTPRSKSAKKFLNFLKPKKMPNQEELNRIVKDSFEIYDEDKSGYLERVEIRKLLDDVILDINAPAITDEKLDVAIAACDENNDGRFDYDELHKLIVPIIESSFNEKKPSILDMFKSKDADGTPRKKKSFFAFLKAKKMPTDEELKKIVQDSFEKYDEDKSGYLEREEIRKLLDDVCEEIGAPAINDEKLDEAIVVADENKDGRFNLDELYALIAPILTNAMSGEKKPTLFDVFKSKTPRGDRTPNNKKKGNLFDFLKMKKKNELPSEEDLRAIVKRFFDTYDEDESGYLERDEIRKLLDDVCEEVGAPKATEEALGEAIEVADRNKDGKFNFAETYDLIGPILENAMSGQKKPTLFDIFKSKTPRDSTTPIGDTTPGGSKRSFMDVMKGIGKKSDAKPKEVPTKEEIEMIAQVAFDLYDADKSGYLERDEIKKLLANVCDELKLAMITDEEQDKAIAQNDTNGDGRFSFEELFGFVGPMIEESLTVYEGETKVKPNFFDMFKGKPKNDGDESINDGQKKPNLFDLLKSKPKPTELPSEEELKVIVTQAFEKYDEDSSGFLERNEIIKLLREVCLEVGAPKISLKEVDAAIEENDKNGDGKIGQDELYSMITPLIQQSWDSRGEKKGLALLFSNMGKKK